MAAGYGVALLCSDTGTAKWGEGLLLFELTVLTVLGMIGWTRPSAAEASVNGPAVETPPARPPALGAPTS